MISNFFHCNIFTTGTFLKINSYIHLKNPCLIPAYNLLRIITLITAGSDHDDIKDFLPFGA